MLPLAHHAVKDGVVEVIAEQQVLAQIKVAGSPSISLTVKNMKLYHEYNYSYYEYY